MTQVNTAPGLALRVQLVNVEFARLGFPFCSGAPRLSMGKQRSPLQPANRNPVTFRGEIQNSMCRTWLGLILVASAWAQLPGGSWSTDTSKKTIDL